MKRKGKEIKLERPVSPQAGSSDPVRIKADYGEDSLGKGQGSLTLFPQACCAVPTAGERAPALTDASVGPDESPRVHCSFLGRDAEGHTPAQPPHDPGLGGRRKGRLGISCSQCEHESRAGTS